MPFAANAIGDDEIRLRTVERRLAGLDRHVRQVHRLANRFDRRLGPVPGFAGADVLVALRIAEAESHAIFAHAERGQHGLSHFDRVAKFVGNLLIGAEDVGIVLSESADAGHAREFARLLEAIHGAELR